jgi:Zn-dependent peptidase ImmA (M78 family)
MSVILTSLIQKRFPEWNQLVCDEETARRICRAERVRIREAKIRARGEYLIYKKSPFIVLKENLPREWRAWVIWHELAHHWLHYPGNYRFHKDVVRKLDFEANFVAAISLIPTFLLENRTVDEIIAEYNYPKELKPVREFIAEYYRK